MLVSLLRLAVFMHHAIKFVAGAFGHRVFQVAHLRFERAQLLEDFERRVHHRLFAGKIDVLGQRSVAKAAQALDLAVVGRLGAHDQPQQRRLARAVAANQTDMFSGIDLKSDAAQHLLRAVGFGHSCETEQHICGSREWGMGNGEWGMGNGEWEVASLLPTSRYFFASAVGDGLALAAPVFAAETGRSTPKLFGLSSMRLARKFSILASSRARA